jgi:hypothetical protein
MGYSATMTKCEFFMDLQHKQEALKAARGLEGHWVRASESSKCRTIEELLEAWGYEAKTNFDGHIIGLGYVMEKLGDDLKMFLAIAPFVKSGSFVEMVGKDGASWRWVFDGTACVEKTGTVDWG